MFAPLALVFALLAGQDQPPECRFDERGLGDYQACADATEPGTPFHNLALINLASIATREGDYERAVAIHDSVTFGPNFTFTSDSAFHALRAHAYEQVGRLDEAAADARLAAEILTGGGPSEIPEAQRNPDPELVLVYILPILARAEDPAFEPALATYMAMPASDWFTLGNRAVVLLELGRLEEALAVNERALALQPQHPAIQNSQCYILTLLGRASEGLPHCQRAVELAPDVAPVRHSIATALAATGQCQEAEAQLAEARRLDPASVGYREPIPCSPA